LGSRLRLANQVEGELRKYFGEKVYGNKIYRNVKIGEAPINTSPTLSDSSQRSIILPLNLLSRHISDLWLKCSVREGFILF